MLIVLAIWWRPHRKLLNPAFSQKILNTFVQEFSEQAKRLVSELATEVGKDSFDVTPYLLSNVIRTVYSKYFEFYFCSCNRPFARANYAPSISTLIQMVASIDPIKIENDFPEDGLIVRLYLHTETVGKPSLITQ